MADEPAYRTRRCTKHLQAVDFEIAQLAKVCQVPLLAPGVIERVLHNDTMVCGHQDQRAFCKLRCLLRMHLSVRDKAHAVLGQEETLKVVNDIVELLRPRFGGRPGTPPQLSDRREAYGPLACRDLSPAELRVGALDLEKSAIAVQ